MVEGSPIDQGVGVALGNGAHVCSSLHLEETLIAPSRAPGVLDVPEVHSIFRAKACCQHGVIDVQSSGSAVGSLVDSGLVVLKASNNLEGNSHGASVVETFSQLNFITLGDIVRTETNISNRNLRSKNALSVLSSVGISNIGFQTSSVLNVFESMGGETSVASVVVEVTCAIDQLLF